MVTISKQEFLIDHEGFREDLWWFQYALDLGFVGKTNSPIENGIPTYLPFNFSRGEIFIWRSNYYYGKYNGTWSAVNVVGTKPEGNVRTYKSLKEALDTEASKESNSE